MVGGAVVVVVLVLLEEAAREEEPADELVLEFVNENGAGGALGTKASPRITSKRTSTQQQTTEPQKDRIVRVLGQGRVKFVESEGELMVCVRLASFQSDSMR